jgi:sterol desaturase/sphingolipid hydroxylase (fatty acid hydroxylase superfamily)
MIESISGWTGSELSTWAVNVLSQFEAQLAIGLLLGAIYLICRAAEHFKPGGDLPSRFGWKWRVFCTTIAELGLVVSLGYVFKDWWQLPSLMNWGESLDAVLGGFLVYFAASFFFYWWHRARHESDGLWLIFHQLHHSPQRLETMTTFYKHPAEVAANSILSAAITYIVFGLTVEGAMAYTGFTVAAQFFVHVNIRTPRWIGYFFQRPEMHRIHHEMDRHKNNYGDIVWWDMLFGTYENPATFDGRCGFSDEREERLADMLLFKDVHKEKQA